MNSCDQNQSQAGRHRKNGADDCEQDALGIGAVGHPCVGRGVDR